MDIIRKLLTVTTINIKFPMKNSASLFLFGLNGMAHLENELLSQCRTAF